MKVADETIADLYIYVLSHDEIDEVDTAIKVSQDQLRLSFR